MTASVAPTATRSGAGASPVSAPLRDRPVVEDALKDPAGAVPLAIAHVELDHAGRLPEEDRQHPGRERVESAAMPDALCCGEPPEPAATTSWDVGPGGLATTRISVSKPGPSDARATLSAKTAAARRTRLGEHDGARLVRGELDRRSPGLGAAASSETAREHRCINPARGFVRTLSRVPPGRLLEEDRHLRELGLGEQVDDPLRSGGCCPSPRGRRRAASTPRSGRPRSWLEPVEDPSEQPEPPAGLRAVQPARDIRSGAPASTSAADTASVRGVAFGWANVAVSMTIPAISAAASDPSPVSSGTPSRAARKVTISHVAWRAVPSNRRPGLRRVRRVMVEDDPWYPLNSSAWRSRTAPTRSSGARQSEITSRS